jgi:hypothetical protein
LVIRGDLIILLFGAAVQIEYYFSDSSLPGDKFLLKKIEESDDDCILLFAF